MKMIQTNTSWWWPRANSVGTELVFS